MVGSGKTVSNGVGMLVTGACVPEMVDGDVEKDPKFGKIEGGTVVTGESKGVGMPVASGTNVNALLDGDINPTGKIEGDIVDTATGESKGVGMPVASGTNVNALLDGDINPTGKIEGDIVDTATGESKGAVVVVTGETIGVVVVAV